MFGAGDEAGDVDHLDRRLDDLATGAHRRERGRAGASATWATPTEVSVVVNGCGATGTFAPVSALNNEDCPEFGSPTRPMRSTGVEATPGPRLHCRGHVEEDEQAEAAEEEESKSRQEAELRSRLSSSPRWPSNEHTPVPLWLRSPGDTETVKDADDHARTVRHDPVDTDSAETLRLGADHQSSRRGPPGRARAPPRRNVR